MDVRQAVVIAAVESRHGQSAFEAVPRLLRERGVEVTDAYLGRSRDDVCKAVKRATKRGERLIVVCGGDGTQTSVVPFFAKRRSVLGVVPSGTGNSFALGLGIEGSFEAAADVIAFGRERRVDLGLFNGTYFANFITIGLEAQVAKETPHPLKAVIGPVAYGAAAIVPILTHRPFRADLHWKHHRKMRVKTHQIIVANGRFYGHQPLAPNATLVDGKLTVFVRDSTSRLDLIQTYIALLRGEQADLSGAHIWSTSKLQIAAKPKVSVAVDGNPFGKTPIRVCVAPRALRVMTPPDGAAVA